MSDTYFSFSDADRIEILATGADMLDRPAPLLEKDIWVVWALSKLFYMYLRIPAMCKFALFRTHFPRASCLRPIVRLLYRSNRLSYRRSEFERKQNSTKYEKIAAWKNSV